MNVLIEDLLFEFKFALPLDLHLVLGSAQLAILVLESLLVHHHGREGSLQIAKLSLGIWMIGWDQGDIRFFAGCLKGVRVLKALFRWDP
jgi:hypothetical protein